jgi:hypothetical protein
MRSVAALLALAVIGCASPTARPAVLPFPADTNTAETIAPGVIRRYIRAPGGPWGVQVLEVDLTRCYSAVAVKGAAGAAGRRKTSDLLAELGRTREVIGGVNADFFSLAGFQGIPTGALISNGTVIVGPYTQPVLAIDSAGLPRATVIRTEGAIVHRGRTHPVTAWNRPMAAGLAVYDAAWGSALDTASGVIEVVVEGTAPARVVRVDTSLVGARIPANGQVIIAGRGASQAVKDWVSSLATGDTLRVALRLIPMHPREAVGGRPMLVRDSVIVPEVDTEGQVSFRNRNPRTAVGVARNARHLILVVVDGRQAPYSDGMTLRELADLMLTLGARDAINLDGGGSSALVYRDPKANTLKVANRPSDPTGERAVGDALAIVRGGRR